MRWDSRVLVAALVLLIGLPAGAGAQAQGEDQDALLSELVPNLYLEAIASEVAAFTAVLPLFGIPVGDLIERAVLRFQEDTFPVIALAGNQLSSFPLASASGGFAWTFDTSSGAVTRASSSFGPIFIERPLTIGRGRLNVGASFQHATFDHLEERSLRDGEIVSYLSVPLPDGDNIFFANALDLKVTSDALNVFATYGLTDRLDLGVAVPINRVKARASLTARIGVTSTGTDPEVIDTLETNGSATGVGDIVIRAKYNMIQRGNWGIAEAVDVRLPTGNELELLGIAGAQVKLAFITASTMGAVSPHFNFAYTISGRSKAGDDLDTFVSPPTEEINYSAGADLAVSLRTTVAAGVVGRVMRRAGSLTWSPVDFNGAQFDEFNQFEYTAGKDLHVLLGSAGVKVNAFGNMLFTTNVLFPFTKNGLTDRLTWMVGADYSF